MKLSGSYRLDAPRAQVFAAITDPGILQRLIDGCEEIAQTGEDTYDAYLKLGVAGFKRTYVGKIKLQDLKAPESYTLHVEGKGGPASVKGTARIALADLGPQTELKCDADVQVGGLIAAVGSRRIEARARKMMDEFFRKFSAELAPR